MKNLYAFFRTLISSVAVCLMLSIHAQSYYPAGLGNANLQLWLTAADPTTVLNPMGTPAADGDFIATWKDKSGRGADATQPTSGAQPAYQTNALNGLGAAIFQNNTEYLTGPAGGYQTVVATRAILGNSYQYLFSSPANADFSVRFNVSASPTFIQYTQGPNYEDWDAYFWSWPYNMWLNGVAGTETGSPTHILVSEGMSATNATYSISNLFSTRGLYNNDPVYELVVYNGTPNNTQRILLENYQASEWGLTGSLPTSGYTKFIPATSTNYNKNLVGIGNSGSDNFLSDVAGSTDGFGFSSGSTASDFLGSTGYAMAAHNAQSNTVNYNPTLMSVPPNWYVWNRSWYVQLFGGNTAGNITVTFNFNDYNSTIPNPASTFALLYNSSDGTFASGTNTLVSTLATNLSGNSVSFAVNAPNLPNGYYTIIYDQNTILPLSLENFSVTKLTSDAALANWTMDPGFGSGSFTVQHSTDGLQFTSIGTVAATDAMLYSYTDHSPAQGINYYRLSMVDAAGIISYSPTGIVTFDESSPSVTLYPIPAKYLLHISAPGIKEARNIDLIAVTGQVLERCSISSLDGAVIAVDRLPAGSYFVRIWGGGQSLVLPFIRSN